MGFGSGTYDPNRGLIGPEGQVLAGDDFIKAVNQNLSHAFGGAPAWSWGQLGGGTAPAVMPAGAPPSLIASSPVTGDMTPAPPNPPAGMTALLSTPFDKSLDDRESRPFRNPLSMAPTAFSDQFAAQPSRRGTDSFAERQLGTFHLGGGQV